MTRTPHKIVLFMSLPKQGMSWLLIGIGVSILLHLLSYVSVTTISKDSNVQTLSQPSKGEVGIRFVKKKKEAKESEAMGKIIETKMEPTEAPVKPSRLGAQDRSASKETRLQPTLQPSKAMDPSVAGKPVPSQDQKLANSESRKLERDPIENSVAPSDQKTLSKRILENSEGLVSVPRPRENKPRNVYESLIPTSADLVSQVQEGYQDFIDEEVEVGERVDFNTTNFRYLGYFTSVRKAFELVWTYPSEAARRGLQGEVRLEFTIQKDGKVSRVRVLESSGHKMLDEGVIEAIEQASPFAPLPPGMNKNRLTIVGSFRYVLTGYGSM